jgi:hypothetical protein
MKRAALIALAMMATSPTIAQAGTADCSLAQVNIEWIEHYTDWKARLVAQGVAPQSLTGMDQALEKMRKAYSESIAKCYPTPAQAPEAPTQYEQRTVTVPSEWLK